MQWNSEEQAYFGQCSDGRTVRVEGDEMAEAAQDAGVQVADLFNGDAPGTASVLLDPNEWAMHAGSNQNVEFV